MKIVNKFKPLLFSQKRYKINKGSAGSAKSVSSHQIEIVKAAQKQETTLFVRKIAKTLRNSCFQLVKDILSKEGWVPGKDYRVNKTDMSFEFPNGSRFVMMGVDDPEKLKSIAGITRVLIEEGTELSLEDFTQIDLRIRGQEIEHPSITVNFNPIDIDHWLNHRFFENKDEDAIIIESDYRDNPFLDEAYIKMLHKLKDIDPLYYDVYVLNQWGTPKTDLTFAYEFYEDKHTFDDVGQIDNLEPLYLAFDFNVSNTCTIWQEIDDEIRCYAEYSLKGGIESVCLRIMQDYPDCYFVICGDATGNSSSGLTQGNISNYQIIKATIDLHENDFRVPKVNPSHKASRTLVNFIFKHYTVKISKDCKNLIMDLKKVQVDDRGSLDAFKKKHPERSHWLDTLRYYLHATQIMKLKERLGDKFFDKINN